MIGAYRPTGRKEVAEAVLIASLSAIVSGAITWAFEEAKKRTAALQAKKAKKSADDENTERPQ